MHPLPPEANSNNSLVSISYLISILLKVVHKRWIEEKKLAKNCTIS